MKRFLLPALAFVLGHTAVAQTYFSDDFNDLNLTGWTNVDNDADAPATNPNYDLWYVGDASSAFPESGSGLAISRSWFPTGGAGTALSPNNFLISPSIDLTSASATGLSLVFRTGTASQNFPQDHYAVYVTTSSDPVVIAAATPVFEETLPAAGMGFHLIDLAAFAGQTVHVTFRHFNTTDKDMLLLDDVAVRTLYPNDIIVQSAKLTRFSPVSTNNTLSLNIKNDGLNTINSLVINWNDGTDHSQTINVNIPAGSTVAVNHPTAVSYATVTEKSLNITVTAVNGNADATANTGVARINTVSQVAAKAVVIEEGTGTWCGWCPRGAVAMEHLDNLHPDNFIGIAVHNADPMAVTAYDNAAAFSGFPGCNVDRVLLGLGVPDDPNDIEDYYDERITIVPPAAIAVSPVIVGSNVTLNVSATFYTPFAASNYRLGVIMTEDDVHGTTTGYRQTNYYSSTQANIPLTGAGHNWQTEPAMVPAASMEYDHVGRALLGGYMGQAGSVPAVITDGQVVNHTFNYTVPATSERYKMHAVAVLIDQNTGEIANAKKIALTSLGVAEAADAIAMEVYPNPASDVVNVKFEGNGGNYTVTITDLAGREMGTSAVSNANGSQNVALSVDKLVAGNYLVTVATEGASYTQHVVVK